MQDLTTGPITRHLLKNMSFMLVTMAFQTLYYLIDLYWVGRLGTQAVAAVGIAGNWTFIVLALTQMLGVGTTTVVAHAIGQKDYDRARLLFNQAQLLAMLTGVSFLIAGLAVYGLYADAMSADAETARLTREYLVWFIPAMALQFTLVAMGSSLRGAGNFKPGMIVGTASVIINMILAPFLIFGWVTGRAFGVAGAAMSSLIAIAVAVVWFAMYFGAKQPVLRFDFSTWKPQMAIWKRMLGIGMPAGFEFTMTAVYVLLVYAVTRPFGAAAQAAFGIGMRIIQSGFMPVVALGFSVAPVAGQNFGARHAERVRATFKDAAWMAAGLMILFGIICQIVPDRLIAIFTHDPAAIAYGEEYLRIISWNFVPSGLIFVASSMFQAMGNTLPSLVSSALRVTLVAVPLAVLTRLAGFELRWIWYLSVATVIIQMFVSLLFLKREFRTRLSFG